MQNIMSNNDTQITIKNFFCGLITTALENNEDPTDVEMMIDSLVYSFNDQYSHANTVLGNQSPAALTSNDFTLSLEPAEYIGDGYDSYDLTIETTEGYAIGPYNVQLYQMLNNLKMASEHKSLIYKLTLTEYANTYEHVLTSVLNRLNFKYYVRYNTLYLIADPLNAYSPIHILQKEKLVSGPVTLDLVDNIETGLPVINYVD